MDPKKLGRIQEDDEYDSDDDFNDRFAALNLRGGRDRSGSERRPSITTGITEVRQVKEIKKPVIEESVIEARMMSRDEAKEVFKQADFQSFLRTTSRYCERALGAEFDFRGEFFTEEEEDLAKESNQDKRKLLRKQFVLEESTDYNRAITSLDWCPSHPELFLASYSKLKTFSLDQADGLVNIYSIAMQNRPELTLNS